MNHYQLLVIGAGPGGYTAALQAAKLGLQTAVVERRDVGGTCLNRGCVPTKALLHASQIYQEARLGTEAGIQAQNLQICLPDLFARQRQTTEKLRSGIEELLQKAKVDLIRGSASITAPGTVQVQQGEETLCLTADRILVATGSVPARPPIPGLRLPGVMTSDELLQGTDQLYRSIVIIGGGVIGGVCVLLQPAWLRGDRGGGIGPPVAQSGPGVGPKSGSDFEKARRKDFYQFHGAARGSGGRGFAVHFLTKDTAQTATAEAVLCAIRRRPNWKGPFLRRLPAGDRGPRIRVNDRFETSIPGVYAIGDVSSAIQLAHVAAAQGTACVNRMCGKAAGVDLSIVPSCVYCSPEIATVGLTEAQAKAAGIPAKTGKCTLFANARTMIANSGRSFIKLVAHGQTREILGAQMMCEHSTDMISQISVAIANHLTVEQLLLTMRPHPTFEEAISNALEELQRKFQ